MIPTVAPSPFAAAAGKGLRRRTPRGLSASRSTRSIACGRARNLGWIKLPSYRDDLEDGGRDHPHPGTRLARGPRSRDLTGPSVAQVTKLDQARPRGVDEAFQPCPRRGRWPDHVDDRLAGHDLEAKLFEPAEEFECDVRFSTLRAPARHHRADELFDFGGSWGDAPRCVVEVFVQNKDTSRPQRAGHTREQLERALHEREHPSRPRAVDRPRR